MNRVYNAVKLDLYTVKASLPVFAIEIIAVIFIGAATKQPSVITAIAMMFATALGSTIFQINEKNNLDKLYGILPLKKLERVLARYLYALILGICCAAIMAVVALILYRALNITLETLPFLAVLGFSFAYYCFAVGISYPIFTRFSFSKTYIFTIAPIFLLFFLLMFLFKQPGFLTGMSKALQFFSAHQYLIILCCVSVGLVFLAVSLPIAYLLSRKKEL
ncbi:ABC-2 transporter permease [Desulfitobacterium chlororespirans]|uniref:ABC-2 family transporter protein n=1 Tax=Desulfitobacterium chlororespirans DSM 11544 TaxID=1121395 RepID=A0A1M7TV77_9FIRM|nr:ABC-2 transporter permease [Desulfitobacterium chlororespirans]SHN74621.1 ABC-2 family transporter protein [Desulfitobacterium chlororespirans DSM 11544]